MVSSVTAELRKHKENKRYGPCQKGAHNLVLALEQSKTVFNGICCWDFCGAFSPSISISLKLIKTQFGSIGAAEPRQIAKKSLSYLQNWQADYSNL